MRFMSYHAAEGGAPRLAVVDGHNFVDMRTACPEVPSDFTEALGSGLDLRAAAQRALASEAPRLSLEGVRYAPVVPRPGKIVCLGLNYDEHAAEGGRDKPSYPWFFLRAPSSLLGQGEAIVRPAVSEQLDYEAELALVIGRRGRHLKGAAALEHVFGYSCFNDVSVRDYQKKTPQWTIGKNFDATGPFGPHLVTADELPPGGSGLGIELLLNGQVLQSSNTRFMIFDVVRTLELLSEAMTLEPGDVVVMGTPSGVGFVRTPPIFMKPGDEVQVRIEGLGVLSNTVHAET